MHALEVIKYIDLIIYNDEKIRSIIHDDIFHLIAMQGQDKPYIISSRGNITSQETKDKRIDKEVQTTIEIYASTYEESVNLQILIDELLSNKTHFYGGQYFYCNADSFTEGVNEDGFFQEITFNIILN